MSGWRFFLISIVLIFAFASKAFSQLDLFAPVANADSGSTNEGIALAINVVANDDDPDILGGIDPATVDLNASVSGIQNTMSITQGDFSVNALGVVTFSPVSGFSGFAVLGYTVNDNAGKTSNVADLTITVVAAGNKKPEAKNDNATTDENTPVAIHVVANDTDSDGTINPTTVDLNVSESGIQNSNTTAQGNFTANSAGIVTYTPTDNFFGKATIKYTVKDNDGATSNEATINIDVKAGPNTAPVATNDIATTSVNTSVTINVVANDTDSDGTIRVDRVDLNTTTTGIQNSISTPQGNYTVNDSGVVTFTPANNFSGTASINYAVNDNEGATSNVATITITVTENPNTAPIAANDNASTNENSPITINVLANDTDSDGTINSSSVDLNTAQSGIQNSRSTTQGNYIVNASGVVTFSPASDFTGSASNSYTVNDNDGATSNIATITIVVSDVANVAPVANNDNANTAQNTAITINVVMNDTDNDGSLNVGTVDLNTSQSGIQTSRSTEQGNYSVNSTGIVTYTPANNFSGTASVGYRVNDNEGATSNTAIITITVNTTPNTAPIANNDNASTSQNTGVTINVVANDTDGDGSINVATVDLNTTQNGIQNSNNVAQGNYSVNSSGIVNYTPAANFSGIATLNYKVNDNVGTPSNTATITITVSGSTSTLAPVANSDQATTHLNTSVTINLIANDTDSDGTIDKSSVDINTSLAGIQKNFEMEEGSLTVNEEGIATFTPAEDFSGTATVNYTVKDNKGTVSNVATIIIEVRDAGIVNLDIPNGFTPNGDGANETWKILTSEGQSPDEFENAEIRVYSKQGVLVYHAKGFGTQWDGKHNGKVLPADTYFYTIDLPDNGVRRKGIVTILR